MVAGTDWRQIRDSAVIQTLGNPDPNMRVLAIYALVQLKATDALPRLRELLHDDARTNFHGFESVAEAAQSAIGKLESEGVH